MHTTVLAMKGNRATVAARITALDQQLADFRASSAFKIAPVEDRERAARPMIAERRELAAEFVRTQGGLVEGARKAWLAATPASVQRKAAIGNPARAVQVAELARLAGPHEALKLATLLVAEQDAPGAYGLRLAVAQVSDGAHSEAAAVALKAGTEESDNALRVLLAAKREYARSVGVAATDPTEKMAAAHLACEIEEEDGSSTTFSEAQIEALIGPPAVEA
jgi:hypothetical protein